MFASYSPRSGLQLMMAVGQLLSICLYLAGFCSGQDLSAFDLTAPRIVAQPAEEVDLSAFDQPAAKAAPAKPDLSAFDLDVVPVPVPRVRPAVNQQPLIERLMKAVDLQQGVNVAAVGSDVCSCGCGLPGCTCDHSAKVRTAVATGPVFTEWNSAMGGTGYMWLSMGRWGTTPEPGTSYPSHGGVLVPLNTQVTSSRPATNYIPQSTPQPAPRQPRYELRSVCRGGVCTIERVRISD